MTTRREILAGTGLAGLAATGTAFAQEAPAIRWRMVTSYPKSLDVLHGTCEQIARNVGELTGGKFQISVHAAGEVVPALAVFDAVSEGSVQCGHTAAYYYIGKNPSLQFDTNLPFGMNARNHLAWVRSPEGSKLLEGLYKTLNLVSIPAGNTGAQMGGFFRKPIKSLEDLKGLRMRIPGWGGRILSELGVTPQNIPAGEVYSALEKGTIDASEWVAPYDDEKLGLFKVAPNYHQPGWWEPSAQLSLYVNAKEWESLPAAYKAALQVAGTAACSTMLADYDAKNPAALRRLVGKGTVLVRFPDDVLQAAARKADELLAAEAAKNATFAALLKSYREFQASAAPWYGISEHSIENFMLRRKA